MIVNDQYIFVYGSLRKSSKHQIAETLRNYSEKVGTAYCFAKLYDLGNYPALVLDKDKKSKTIGEIYEIFNPDYLIKILDDYEGIGNNYEKPHEYRRVRTSAYFNTVSYNCWVYEYNLETKISNEIESGDYLAYLKEIDAKASKKNFRLGFQ